MFSSARRLASLVAAGLFSRRLYDLLSDSTLLLPPLRRRIRDLGCLVDHQVSKFATGKETVVFSPESYGALVTYPWPGNYQQLEDELRKLLRAADAKIELDNLPASIASFWTGGAERPDVRRVHEQLTESMEEYKILALLDAEFGNLLLTSGEWGDGSVKPGPTGPVR
jgi:DNA-binding NtrC family response regulator